MVVPALPGATIAPAAVRVRSLYPAFVTLGLVIIERHTIGNMRRIAGDSEGGRGFQELELGVFDFMTQTDVLGRTLYGNAVLFLFSFDLIVIAVLFHKNPVRARIGRAWQSIPDRPPWPSTTSWRS